MTALFLPFKEDSDLVLFLLVSSLVELGTSIFENKKGFPFGRNVNGPYPKSNMFQNPHGVIISSQEFEGYHLTL